MTLSRGLFPWATDACVALVPVLRHLGDDDAARAAVEQAMRAATTSQSRRRLGGALRVAGLLEGGERGVELLRQAVDTLADSPPLLWRARAFVDLGAALRNGGHAASARPRLRAGMERTHRCGATALADRAE